MSARLIFLLVFLLGLAAAEAGDRIWSAVVLATESAKPKPAPAELRPLAARLERVFGCNQFEIVGRATANLDDDAKVTLAPTKTFWLKLGARRASSPDAKGGYLLNLVLYQDQRPLVDTVTVVAPGSPLFFRGPMSARGQVIVVLQVQR